MGLIGELYNPEVVLLPIGSYFTMDELQAAKAVELLKPKAVIPMHFGTFPVITADTNKFSLLVSERNLEVTVETMKPGESRELNF
jgi:L-ascorbate metabolism protein UlaG (beta-lactamase superfamily)